MHTIVAVVKKIGNGISCLNEYLAHGVAWTIFLMVCLVMLDISLRYFFKSSLTWATELNETFLLPVMALIPGGYTLKEGTHVGIDVVYRRFSVRTKAIVDLFTSILFFAFCFVLIKYGWNIAWRELIAGTRIPREPYWPIFPVRFLIPLSASLLVLQGLVKFVSNMKIAMRGTYPKESDSEK